MANIKEYTDPKTGKKYPVGGCIISDKKQGPLLLGASPFKPKHSHLPESVNLKKDMTPIEQQGISNCW